ncbi:MAG: hypothetical protein PHX16_06205 [Syntrophaceticus sp.]|nr:hypothetical protein [Syntrophaceticus sp.]MDD4783211.1 hypothetical protein [Syntrophaceticus sp.]
MKKLLIIIGVLVVIVVIALVFLLGENTKMKEIFKNEVQAEMDKNAPNNEVITEEDISELPEPVQRYFRYCGYVGKEKMVNAKLIFDDVNFKMNVDQPWINLKYEQYNFVNEPARVVYMYTRMYGIVPFEGKDRYLDGYGNMLGQLLKKITLFDVTGREMDISAAGTFLSEILMVPSCALQDYIHWEEIDENHARAMIEYNDVKAEGIFTFNDQGEFVEFVTDERYMDTGDGQSEKHKWTAAVSDYVEKDGIKKPTKIKGIWNLPEGDYEYFNGTLTDVVYNCEKV